MQRCNADGMSREETDGEERERGQSRISVCSQARDRKTAKRTLRRPLVTWGGRMQLAFILEGKRVSETQLKGRERERVRPKSTQLQALGLLSCLPTQEAIGLARIRRPP